MPRKTCSFFLFVVFILNTFGSLKAQGIAGWEQVVPLASFGYGQAHAVNWSPRTGQLVVASETGLQFYNENLVLEGERRFAEPYTGNLYFSPDMHYVALEEMGGLVIRATDTWQPVLALGTYRSPSWSPNSRNLAIWAGNALRVWDVERQTVMLEVAELISDGGDIQWSPDSAAVAVAGPGAIIMVGASSGAIVRIHPFHEVISFDWSDDGQWFGVIGLREPPPIDHDPEIPLAYELMKVNAVTGEIDHRYDIRTSDDPNSINSAGDFVEISPNGEYIAANLRHWLPPLEEPPAGYISGWHERGLFVWLLDSGESAYNFRANRELTTVYRAEWSPDGEYLAYIQNNSLNVVEAFRGGLVQNLQAYIAATNRTEWIDNGTKLVAAGGIWDVSDGLPVYEGIVPPAPPGPPPLDLKFLEPNPYVFDYNRPPYEWKILQVYEDRGLVITYEKDIEYPGTPEYEDEEPPDERYIIWNIATQERWEEYVNLGEQTAWIYDLDNADERADGNTYFNVLRTTRFVAIGDDEIVDLRTGTLTALEVNRWEWREVWFSPRGERIMAYDTDQRFKAYDPVSGELLYQTEPVERGFFHYSPDQTQFFVKDVENTLYLYDSATGELLLETYTGNTGFVLLWSSDMRRVAIGGDNNAVIVYDIPTQTRLAVLRGHQSAIRTMNWYPDCDYANVSTCDYIIVSSDNDGRILLWGVPHENQATAAELPQEPAPPTLDLPIANIDYSALEPLWTYVSEGDELGRAQAYQVSFGANGIIVNSDWYYDTRLNLLDEHPGGDDWILPRDTTLDGLKVYSDGTVYVEAGESLGWVGRDSVHDVVFADDGRHLFTAESIGGQNTLTGWIREWSVDPQSELPVRPVTYFGGGSPGYNNIDISPDGQWLVTTSIDFYGSGGRGQIWSVDRDDRRYVYASLIGHRDTIIELYWHSISNHILTASLDGSIRMWDQTGAELARWTHPEAAPIIRMTWGPTLATVMVSAGHDLCEINSYTLEEIRCFTGMGGLDFDWSPDKKELVSIASDSILRVIDYESGEVLAEERRHMPDIVALEWHPSSKYLAVARRNGSVILLDSQTGMLDAILRPYGAEIRSMQWDPDGERLLLDLANTDIDIIDGQSGETVTHIENEWRRKGVWWSPDGQQLAFGTFPDPDMGVYTATSLVWVYDVETGEPLHQLALDWDDYIWYWDVKPFGISWSDDASRLVAFYGTERIRAWDLGTGEILSTHYGIGRTFSFALWQDEMLYFWTTDGKGSLNLANDTLEYIARDGLPVNSELRPDGQVILADNRILDFQTFYPLQQLRQFTDAAWHPTCYTSECEAIIAVAFGSNIAMFGYPEE